jgi:hypothetical protein
MSDHPRDTTTLFDAVEAATGKVADAASRGTASTLSTFIDGWNDRCRAFAWTRTPTPFSPKPMIA